MTTPSSSSSKDVLQKSMTNLLAVDPGLSNTGWAIFSTESESLTLKFCGVISPKQKYPIPKRLSEIYYTLFELIHTHNITDIALETPFLGKNAQSFLKLGYIRGLLYLLAEIHGLSIHEYPPQVIKKIVSGHGFSDKDVMAAIVRRLYYPFQIPDKHDITDAVAIGTCAYRLSSGQSAQ